MATRTWDITKDTTLFLAPGPGYFGNGNDAHAPIGVLDQGGGVTSTTRYFAQFAVDTSGMASITSATLHLRASQQTHMPFGSSPTLQCDRVVASWVGSGGSEGAWSNTANPKWDTAPAVTGSGETVANMTRTEKAWDTIDVTDIANAWRSGQPNYGIRLRAGNEGSNADSWECYAQGLASSKPYITVVYVPIVTTHPPVADPITPLVGTVADLQYLAGSGWVTPVPTLSWAFSDPDAGAAQSAYQVIIYNDSAGSPGTTFLDTGKVTSSATVYQPVATFTEGNYYHWKVQVWDQTDLVSAAYTATQRFRVRWGAAEYVFDMGATPLAWALSTLTSVGNVVVEYNSSANAADPGASLGTWASSLALVTKRRYVRYRVWLMPQAGTTPSLDKLVISYNTAALPSLDNWTFSTNAKADASTRVFGVQSLRIDAAGADERTYQLVPVEPDTTYQLTGRIKQSALSVRAFLTLGSTTTGGDLVSVPASTIDTDWTQVGVEWFSGARTNVYVQCGATGTGTAWFDTLKLEASPVATQWTPNVLNKAVVLDASGLKVDGSQGGNIRLRGSTGGTRDIVEMGANGLKIGGDVNVSSPAAAQLLFGNTSIHSGGTSFPTSPTVDDRFYHLNRSMEYFWDGTRWLSTFLFVGTLPAALYVPSTGITATQSPTLRGAIPMNGGGSDVWLVDRRLEYMVTGGTALSGSHKWDTTFEMRDSADAATTVNTVTINSGSLGVWRVSTTSINAIAAGFMLTTSWTKTGTPGTVSMAEVYSYRLVAT